VAGLAGFRGRLYRVEARLLSGEVFAVELVAELHHPVASMMVDFINQRHSGQLCGRFMQNTRKMMINWLADSGDAESRTQLSPRRRPRLAGKAEVAAALLDCRGGRTAIAISQGR
jgi:hypothetical protein